MKILENIPYHYDNRNDSAQLKLYDQGNLVKTLQEKLIALEFLRGEPNGIFGFNTRIAVEKFQLFYEIPITGIVDSFTWNKISEAVNNPFPSSRPTLKLGDEGVSVKQLEQRLIMLDFLEFANPNGLFDENTENAVLTFQTARGLNPDGVVGPRTWREIEQLFAATSSHVPNLKPTVKLGDENEYVKLLQNKLISYGYLKNHATGIFDEDTMASVIKFQETYSLEPNGIVDYFTWEVLDSLLKPNFINLPLLREGSTAPEVLILQEKLKVADFFPGTITGSFGSETTDAVKRFQAAENLNVTGTTTKETWITLFEKTAILTRAVLNKPTLRLGDEGPYVSELQRDLKQLMFYDGIIDGVFGNKTLEAVKAFQINNKLTADGIVGRQTWSALIYLYSPLAICRGDEGNVSFKGVVIDAGHGGTDPGAVSKDIIEKEYTLKISQYMNNRFRELGVPVYMTRNNDETLSREERIKRMKEPFGDVKEAIVISNHINAGGGDGMNVVTIRECEIVCI